MRLTIRHQLLLPLLTLMVGVVVLSAWSAWSAAERARQRIEHQLDSAAETVSAVTFKHNIQTLKLMKGLSGAEFLVSPSLNLATIEMANRYSKVITPGALTPTEVLTAWQAGGDIIKIFPCGAVGGKYDITSRWRSTTESPTRRSLRPSA